jgi:hypothetical protein
VVRIHGNLVYFPSNFVASLTIVARQLVTTMEIGKLGVLQRLIIIQANMLEVDREIGETVNENVKTVSKDLVLFDCEKIDAILVNCDQ